MEPNELTWPERTRLWARLGIRLALGILALFLLIWVLPPLLSLLAPFVGALIAAALLNPLVRRAQQSLGWNRRVLSLLILLLLFGLLGGALALLTYYAGREVVELAQNWEVLLGQARAGLEHLEDILSRIFALVPEELAEAARGTGEQLLDWLQGAASAALTAAVNRVRSTAIALPAVVFALVVFVMATYFLTADYPYLRTRAASHLSPGALVFWGHVRTAALVAFGGYLKAQVLLSVGVFFILLAGFWITGREYALLLALGLAVLDFIPIVGSGTVMVPWAVWALFSRDFSTAISVMLMWWAVALFRRVAEPKFVGDQTGLSPILSLVSIYVGFRLAGVAGMILAPILVLVGLNLAGLGLFRGVRDDLIEAAEDLSALLSRRER